MKNYALKIAFIAFFQFLFFCSYAQNIPIGTPYTKSSEVFSKGFELQGEEKYLESIKEFEKIHNGDSSYIEAQVQICFSYFFADSNLKALSTVEKLINSEYYERKIDCYIIKINALENLNRIPEAMNTCSEAIKLFSKSPRFYVEMAELYELQSDYAKAYDYYTQALVLCPTYYRTHRNLGALYAKMDLPSLSILAYQTYLLISTDVNEVARIIKKMEDVCKNQNEIKSNYSKSFKVGYENIDEIDLVVKSQVALDDNFKSKIKLTFLSNKQVQLISEMISKGVELKDYTAKFYIDFYTKIWNNNHFEGMILNGYKEIDNDVINKERQLKKKKVDAFIEWGSDDLKTLFTREDTLNGKKEMLTFSYSGGKISSVGKYNSDGKKVGYWRYYSDNGSIHSYGVYDNDKTIGLWTYCHDNGKIAKRLILNNDGIKDGYFKTYDEFGQVLEDYGFKDDLLSGLARIYRPNGSIKFEGEFQNDTIVGYKKFYSVNSKLSSIQKYKANKLEGLVLEFDDDSVLVSKAYYVNELRNGETEYYENGKLSSKGKFVNDLREGEWTWYHPNGKINYVSNYVKDNPEGKREFFDEDGRLTEIDNYQNGQLNGLNIIYDINGKKIIEANYKKGMVTSIKYFDASDNFTNEVITKNKSIYVKSFNSYRQPISEGLSVNNNKEGEWIYYFPNGVISAKVNYKNNNIDGLYTTYDNLGNKLQEFFYVNDQLEGYSQSYYFNGVIKSQGYYLNDKKIGLWKYYYLNGKLSSQSFNIDGEYNGEYESFEYDGSIFQTSFYSHDQLYQINQFKNDKIYYTSKISLPGNGKLTYKFPCNTLRKENNYQYGKLQGNRTVYNFKGQIEEVANYKYGNYEGTYKSFDPFTSTLLNVGNYKNDKKEGEWLRYNFGKLIEKETFKDGENEGEKILYSTTGDFVIQKFNYSKGLLNGEELVYSSEKDLAIKLWYDWGVLTKYTYLNEKNEFVPYIPIVNETAHIVAYYPNKNKSIDFSIRNGYYEGAYTLYYTNGTEFVKDNFVNNFKHGVSKCFYPNGQLSYETEYYYGILNSTSKQYFSNGKLKISLNHMNDEYHGELIEYNDKGVVINRANYKYGYGCE